MIHSGRAGDCLGIKRHMETMSRMFGKPSTKPKLEHSLLESFWPEITKYLQVFCPSINLVIIHSWTAYFQPYSCRRTVVSEDYWCYCMVSLPSLPLFLAMAKHSTVRVQERGMQKYTVSEIFHEPPIYSAYSWGVIFGALQPQWRFYFKKPMKTALGFTWPKMLVFSVTRQHLQNIEWPSHGGGWRLINVRSAFNTNSIHSLSRIKGNRCTWFALAIFCWK